MRNFWFFLTALISLSGHAIKLEAQPAPEDEVITNRIALSINSGWEVTQYREIASLRMMDPISPELRIRFEANVRSTEPLYLETDKRLGSTAVLVETVAPGAEHVLHGSTVLSYEAGDWDGSINFETKLERLGRPATSVTGPWVISGSEAEASLKAIEEEAFDKLEEHRQVIKSLETRLAEASSNNARLEEVEQMLGDMVEKAILLEDELRSKEKVIASTKLTTNERQKLKARLREISVKLARINGEKLPRSVSEIEEFLNFIESQARY